MGIPRKVALGNIIIIVNVFVWYTYASAVVRDIVDRTMLLYGEKLAFYILMFFGSVFSILAGTSLANKFSSRKRFFLVWTLIGIFSSFTLIILETPTIVNVLIVTLFVSISFGLGLPISIACFADITKEENRARFGSIAILFMFLGTFAFGFIMSTDLFLNSVVIAVWRCLGLIGISLSENLDNLERKKNPTFVSLLNDRSVLLYLIPWTAFSLVNYLSWPISSKIHGEDFVYFSSLIENIIAGISALLIGFLADNIGRKRVLVSGFIIFGIGYAVLGIYPSNVNAWYFYMLADGIAWGMIYVIFWFTIWGDLAHENSSEKYYALGILPYALSGFLRVTIGSFMTNVLSEYAIFSFAALFLFLAVLPLMYAPETLPEKRIRERELRQYVEKAKKIREKSI
jgi:MFS family permease